MQVALSILDLMRKPKITATVPEDVYEFLSEWAERDQRSLANVVAFVLTTTVRKMRDEQQQKNGSASPQATVSPLPEIKPSSKMPDTKPPGNQPQTNSPSPSKSKGEK